MFVMITIFSAVLAAVWAIVWASLVRALMLPSSAVFALAIVFLAAYFLQFLRLFSRRPIARIFFLQFFGNFVLGLMVQLFFGAVLKEIVLFCAGSFFRLQNMQALDQTLSAWTISICFVANAWGVWTALKGPRIKKIRIVAKDWPKSQDGFRIVQISDLHVGPLIKSKYVQSVVCKALELEPDLIALTGDIGDGSVAELEEELEPLRSLAAEHGVFYVSGNHEYYSGIDSWMKKMAELGMKVLFNEGSWLGLSKHDLWIGGVPDISCNRIRPDHESKPAKAFPPAGREGFKILLAHQPKSCFEASKAGFDLMLSGHTHAGQFFPVRLLVGFFNPYAKGLNLHEKMLVYVNSGTGFWGPPQRLWVPSEITCLEIFSTL